MRFLVVDQLYLHPDGLRLLEQGGHSLVHISPGQLQDGSPEAAGIITSVAGAVSAAAIAKVPKLKVVISCSAGLDHIDLAACKERKIAVYSAPGSNANAVAEHTLALLFAVLRKVHAADRNVRAGGFEQERFLGLELDGKTVGVVGFGAIGRLVAKKLRGFSVRVLAYDPLLTKEQIEGHPDVRGMDVRKVERLDELLERADIISIHVPLLESTRDLISAKEFARMKQDAVLLNTSRGPVVNEAALLAALREQRIFGAGLDVFAGEPAVNRAFFSLDNAVLTPHVAAMTQEACRAMAVQAVEAFVRADRAEGGKSGF